MHADHRTRAAPTHGAYLESARRRAALQLGRRRAGGEHARGSEAPSSRGYGRQRGAGSVSEPPPGCGTLRPVQAGDRGGAPRRLSGPVCGGAVRLRREAASIVAPAPPVTARGQAPLTVSRLPSLPPRRPVGPFPSGPAPPTGKPPTPHTQHTHQTTHTRIRTQHTTPNTPRRSTPV